MPSARQAPRISVVLPAPTSPLTTTTSPGERRSATRAPSASVSAAELVSRVSTSAEHVELVFGRGRRGQVLAGGLAFGGSDLLGARGRCRRRARGQVGNHRQVFAQLLLHRRRAQGGGRVQQRQQEDGAAAKLVDLRGATDLGDSD